MFGSDRNASSLRHFGRSSSRFGAACIPLLLAAFPPSAAGQAAPSPVTSLAQLPSLGEPVGDDALGEIRGKFIRPGQIDYFGISMVTSWQDSSGITTLARLVFSVDFMDDGSGPTPRLLVGWTREGDPALDVSTTHDGYSPYIPAEQVIAVGGLDTQNGVGQANVIAGADNRAANDMTIAIVPASQLSHAELVGLNPVNGSTAVTFGDGDTLEFRAADNQLALVMTGGDGIDSSVQSIGGDIGNLLQQNMLATNANNLRNTTDIIIGTGLGDTGTAARMSEAVTVMRGFGF